MLMQTKPTAEACWPHMLHSQILLNYAVFLGVNYAANYCAECGELNKAASS